MNEQRNLLIAIVLSVLILFGFQWLYPKSQPPAPVDAAAPAASAPPVPQGAAQAPATPAQAPSVAESRASALEATRRIPVRTPKLHGSIAVTGARLDDLLGVESALAYLQFVFRTATQGLLEKKTGRPVAG